MRFHGGDEVDGGAADHRAGPDRRGGLSDGGAFEVFALKGERLGLIYVGILGAEVVILGAISHLCFKEIYSARELTGMALVLVGTAIAWT